MSTHMLDRAAPAWSANTPAPRMLRVAEVAKRLDLPEKRLYILAREGIIPHVRLGRSIRFNEAELEAWIAAGGSGYPGTEE